MFDKGLSVSYDRVLQLSTYEANRTIEMHENEDCVCPSTLRDNLFTTRNIDNHNPSSTSSRDSFHGTAISITQHTTNENAGVVRIHRETAQNGSQPKGKSLKFLPKSYTSLTNN